MMSPEIIAIVVGLLVGWAGDFLLKEGGYGMTPTSGLASGAVCWPSSSPRRSALVSSRDGLP